MPRISNKKTINNILGNDSYAKEYIKIIDYLQTRYKVSDGSKFKDLVNFKNNKVTPKHRWYEYKQGYSEDLVKNILETEQPSKEYYVLDPFVGVGTTALVSQRLGYKSIGFDINPVAILASKVKTSYYSVDEKNKISTIIASFSAVEFSPINPEPRVITTSFSKNILQDLYRVKAFCENLEKREDIKIANFFKLAYISIIEDCSVKTKDGNGLKLNIKKKPVENVFQYFLAKCKGMLNDIEISNYKEDAILINGSLIINNHINEEKDYKVGISIFSPPYANCFDYCEVYKLEFWLGWFVSDYDGFKKYRDIAMRSHVNASFNHEIKNYNDHVDTIAKMIGTYNIWNKNIPDMIRGYFDDTHELLRKMFDTFVGGASCYIVVANSGYKGILVPTDLLIAEIAESLGYVVEKILIARNIRSSSQQTLELQGKYNDLTRESIVVIRKPLN
jgi:hypothetical protein